LTLKFDRIFYRDGFGVPMAWVAWAAFTLLVVVMKFDTAPTYDNVFNIYREAAFRWRNGQDLYSAGSLFVYFPPAALFLTPWTWMPFDVGGAVWRTLNLVVFALGVWRISGASGTPALRSFFPIASKSR